MSTALVRVQGGPPARPVGQGGAPPVAASAAPRPWRMTTTRLPRIWNGQTLDGWNGESDVWSIVNGHIPPTPLDAGAASSAPCRPGAVVGDFDLKVNSRSRRPAPTVVFSIAAECVRTAQRLDSRSSRQADACRRDDVSRRRQGGIAERAPARTGGPGPGGQRRAKSDGGLSESLAGQRLSVRSDSGNRYTGQLQGQGRGIVNLPGGIVKLLPGATSRKLAPRRRRPRRQ